MQKEIFTSVGKENTGRRLQSRFKSLQLSLLKLSSSISFISALLKLYLISTFEVFVSAFNYLLCMLQHDIKFNWITRSINCIVCVASIPTPQHYCVIIHAKFKNILPRKMVEIVLSWNVPFCYFLIHSSVVDVLSLRVFVHLRQI